jgi:hypothetical protein
MEDLLKKFNIDTKTLTQDELQTLDKWANALSQKTVSTQDIAEHVSTMIESIERELTGHENPPITFANLLFRGRRERHLKARLQNYVVLRDFLTAPQRARSYVEKQLVGFRENITRR